VLYTALIGRYETLNELAAEDPDVTALCFTDDPDLTSTTWEVVLVDRAFPSDPVRSQRKLKIVGHPALADFDEWIYIDNTVRLLVPPSTLLDDHLQGCDLAIPTHSFRDTVEEEFVAVDQGRLDSHERVTEQLEHYRRDWPDTLAMRPLWNGIILRRNTPAVASWADAWWSHLLRYSRRDQLSVHAAAAISGVPIRRIDIDTRRSAYHEWPILTDRDDTHRFTDRPQKLDLTVLRRRIRSRLAGAKRWLSRSGSGSR
jgi:hypothetical protein